MGNEKHLGMYKIKRKNTNFEKKNHGFRNPVAMVTSVLT